MRYLGILAASTALGLVAAAFAAEPSAPERLPREAVGVIGSGDQLRLIIAEGDKPRTIRLGQEYSDGWTLKALTHSEATLIKGSESRRIGLNPTGVIVQTPVGGDSALIQAISGDPIQQGVLSQPNSRACEAEYSSKTIAPRSDAEAAAMPSRAQILGPERAEFCERAIANVMLASRTPGGRRALALARGDINEVRSIDGLPSLGPDEIPNPQVRTYTDETFAPGAFTTIGYIRGANQPDGTFTWFRTREAWQAAIAAGRLPPPPSAEQQDAMLRAMQARSEALRTANPPVVP